MKIKRGTVWPWTSVVLPPDGWDFLPTSVRYASRVPLGIVALRDHDEPPVLPEEYLRTVVDGRVSPQARLLGAPVGEDTTSGEKAP